MLDAFIAEFPEAYTVNSSALGGEYEEAWAWLFDLADKMRPAISDGLRARTLAFFEDPAEEWTERYIAKVREHRAKLPRKETPPAP